METSRLFRTPAISTSAGKYIVSLTVSNASGQSTITKDNYITATAAPVAAFISDRTKGVEGENKLIGLPVMGQTDYGCRRLLRGPVHELSDRVVVELRRRRDGDHAKRVPPCTTRLARTRCR